MGAKCCRCHKGSVKSDHASVLTLTDFREQETDLKEMEMEETRGEAGPSGQEPPSSTLGPSEAVGRFGSVTLKGESSNTKESPKNLGQDGHRASDILWSTGSFSEPIPDGFYSVIPDHKLKLFKNIPTLAELDALGDKDLKRNVILVDSEKDKTLIRLKDLITRLVGESNPNQVSVIKKIGGLVRCVYKRKNLQSPKKATEIFESNDFPLLGQINHGSCRARALLFKFFADMFGLQSRIVLGFPSDVKSSASVDSHNHMSVLVVINSVEMLVDLVRSPGQLIYLSDTKALYMAHILAAGTDPCYSPLEQSSPMNRIEDERLSRSEPNIATELWPRSQGIVIKEQLTATSSCNLDGPGNMETKRITRSRSTTPEISDDIVRSVRAMRESIKQSRFSKERGDDNLQKNKAILLPSSPQNYQIQSSERSEASLQNMNRIWNEMMESPMFQNEPLLPYEEWKIDFSELTIGTTIGVGFFGVVSRGTWKGTDVAVKMLLEKNLTAEDMEVFSNEVSILSRLRHPNVILFLRACTKPPQLSVVTEFVEGGSLYYVLHSTNHKDKLSSWKKKLKMMRDICRGLMCIHRMGIVHRDLKSANCLLTNKWTVKICDFGLSRMMKSTTVKDTVAAGTPEWMAPELIRNEPLSEKCDIFSFGVIMWEICTLSKPWDGVPIEKVVYTVANEGARLELPEGPVGKLIADCWSEPEQRPSCGEILSRLALCEYSLS